MPYRRTEKVVRRLAARHDAILAAARTIAAESGMAAVQIAPVAQRAGIAAGTVYRYFPAKTDLVAALIGTLSKHELARLRRAADAAPGPLSAFATAIATFAERALAHRKLAWAVMGETAEAEVDAIRLTFRQALAAELDTRLRAAIASDQVPEQDTMLTATALVGALLDGLAGPLAPEATSPQRVREVIQAMTLLTLRAIGVADGRARGLVVQATAGPGR